MSQQLLQAIGPGPLTGYFEHLDEAVGGRPIHISTVRSVLRREHPGMARQEAEAVADAWQRTFYESLPAEDRADKALEPAEQ